MSDIARELGVFLGIDASVPPIAVAESAPPPQGDGGPPYDAAHRLALPGGATTTASAVIRPSSIDFAGPPFGPRPNALDRGAAAPERVETPGRKHSFTLPALPRRTLISAGALVSAVALIAVVAVKTNSNRSAERASSSVIPPGVAAPASSPELPSAIAVLPASSPELPSAIAAANVPVESPPAAENPASGRPALPEADPAPAALASTVSPISGAPAAETAVSAIRVKVANPRPGLRVAVDGRTALLPLKLPRDQKSHVLVFTAPNFKPETKTIVADQDHTLTLDYRPRLYVP